MRKTPIWVGWLLAGLLLAGSRVYTPAWGGAASAVQADAALQFNWNSVMGQGPAYYGVEYVWVDEDQALFLERYRSLAPRVLRVQVSQEAFEPQNDNSDPNFSEINFNQSFVQDAARGKTLNYETMFKTLGAEFPAMHFHINIWLAARWNAASPDGYLGLGGAFPPRSLPEHQEFIRALAGWLVTTCGIAPERLSFSFVNEPNLKPFFTGSQSDLIAMATATRSALDQVSPRITLAGLDEVHGLGWTDSFYPSRPAGCCDFWTFHAYARGLETLWTQLAGRSAHLAEYGPVWVTEFADTNFGSPDAGMNFSSKGAALEFARLGARLWAADVEGVIHFRLADTYLDSSALQGWAGHGLFADWRGTKSGGEAYAVYPSFWVFANLFQRLGDGEVIQGSFAGSLEGVAVKPQDGRAALAIWVVNPSLEPVKAQVQVAGFPSDRALVERVDGLAGLEPVQVHKVAGSPLEFEAVLEAESATLLWITARPVAFPVFIPMLLIDSAPGTLNPDGTEIASSCKERSFCIDIRQYRKSISLVNGSAR